MYYMLLLVLLVSRIASAQWVQDRFIIGAWGDPELTNNTTTDETMLRRYVDGNFNFLSGYGDRYSYRWNTQNGSRNITNQYFLNRVAAVNNAIGNVALRASVHEAAFLSAPVNLANYTGLTGALANALHGYSVVHEPRLDNLSRPNTSALLSDQLNRVSDIRNADASRITFDVLGSYWAAMDSTNQNFTHNWNRFDNYVTTYINNSATRVASFDYYILSQVNGLTNYSTAGADRVNYYRTLDLFGRKTKTANKEFWGFASGNDRQIDWWNGTTHLQEVFPYPTANNLRFNAYSNIIYGAKGIIWYTYDVPTTDCNPAVVTCETFNAAASSDNTIYSRIQSVNREMRNMGPTLMRLDWQTTIHGSSTDPFSNETGLPVVGSGTPAMANENFPNNFAIGIHTHLDNGRPYLTIFNKNWQSSVPNQWFATKGFNDIYSFNKSTSTWTRIPNSISYSGNKTAFSVSFNPGDLQLLEVRGGVIHPLHQYWQPTNLRHYYTERPEGTTNVNGYQYQRTIGGLYKTQVTGTTKLYQYANPNTGDWYYTKTWQGNNNCCGWVYQRDIGYLFASQQPGTVPMYQYWNAALGDHYYTNTWEGNSNGHGWDYQEIVGYLVPNN